MNLMKKDMNLLDKYHSIYDYIEKVQELDNLCKLKLFLSKFHKTRSMLNTITINYSFLLQLQVFGESIKDPNGQLS